MVTEDRALKMKPSFAPSCDIWVSIHAITQLAQSIPAARWNGCFP